MRFGSTHLSLAAVAISIACGDAGPTHDPVAAAPDTAATSAERVAPDADPFAREGLEPLRPEPEVGWPLENVHITSSFGWRVDPVTGQGVRLHKGLDFRGNVGDLVISIAAGTVRFVGHDALLGNLVIIDHGQDIESFYGHLDDVLVMSGVPVQRGSPVGLVGNTGRSQAPHLHLTVKVRDVPIDPLILIGQALFVPEAVIVASETDGSSSERTEDHSRITPMSPLPP